VFRLLNVYIFMLRESTKEENENAASVEFSMDSCFKILKYFISNSDKLNVVHVCISLHTKQSTLNTMLFSFSEYLNISKMYYYII
jgi:hypothetical protein